jgi:GDP/UDP-N,N'-diacetylbacillosamine 2-epimerase (hydrolysing)
VVNIGDRQKGREQADSVINCGPTRGEIARALARAISPEYQAAAAAVINPYGKAGASEKIASIVATFPLACLIRKSFHEIP